MHGMRTSDIPWLRQAGADRCPSDLAMQKRLLRLLLVFLLETIVVPLLRSAFYVTEHSKHKSAVFYYRKCLWREIDARAKTSSHIRCGARHTAVAAGCL